jgi:hypothetical protein
MRGRSPLEILGWIAVGLVLIYVILKVLGLIAAA